MDMPIKHHPWASDDDGTPEMRVARWYGAAPRPASSPPPAPRPTKRKKAWEPHDDETRRMIRLYNDMYRLQHSEKVVPLLEDWKWRDKMETAAEKQRYLEPLLGRVRRAPEKNQGEFVFLLLVFESVRRGVERLLLDVRSGLDAPSEAPAAFRREEAKRLAEIERGRLVDVTRQAMFEAIYRYPSPPPRHLFGWLRETVAHFTLNFLHDELAEVQTTKLRAQEAEAMQAFLRGFEDVDPPDLGEGGGFRRWHFGVRWLYEPVAQYLNHYEVRTVCRTAVDRLPRRQQEVIRGEFYDGKTPVEIAEAQGVARSTVYNSKAQALANLGSDDRFFMALHGMQLVRDSERAAQLREQFPGGVMPDGRRRVVIADVA
jgi:DNA-directed RNA polymerase specialized sigma24 family protein